MTTTAVYDATRFAMLHALDQLDAIEPGRYWPVDRIQLAMAIAGADRIPATIRRHLRDVRGTTADSALAEWKRAPGGRGVRYGWRITPAGRRALARMRKAAS